MLNCAGHTSATNVFPFGFAQPVVEYADDASARSCETCGESDNGIEDAHLKYHVRES